MQKIFSISYIVIILLLVPAIQSMNSANNSDEYASYKIPIDKNKKRVIETKERVVTYIEDLTRSLNKSKNRGENLVEGLKKKFSRYACPLTFLNQYPTILVNFLYALVSCNYADTLIWLVAQGININVRGNEGTALHVATLDNNYKMIELVCKLGVDVDAPDGDGDRALHLAVACGDGEAIELLLAYDADVMLKNNEGKTPAGKLEVCPPGLQPEISSLLMDARCDQEVAQACKVFGIERRRIVYEYYQKFVLPCKEEV